MIYSGHMLPESLQDSRNVAFALAAALCILAPLELNHFVFAALGAAAFWFIQRCDTSAIDPMGLRPKAKLRRPSTGPRMVKAASGGAAQRNPTDNLPPKRRMSSSSATAPHAPRSAFYDPNAGSGVRSSPPRVVGSGAEGRRGSGSPPKPTMAPLASAAIFPSVKPVAAPTLHAPDFDTQVEELVAQIAPTAQDDRIACQLARIAQSKLRKLIPDVQVTGTACGCVGGNTAFGVAVPEVDIVVSASPATLMARLPLQQESISPAGPDARKLQKSAIRSCTDCLVASGTFKFRRSAFRSMEPKVTLLAPATLGVCDQAVPVDFSVNCATPLHNAALLTECGKIDRRAGSLALLVRRWAKDRGICHAAKGHLPPYAWTLLVIYYLQVGVEEEGYESILPALDGFAMSSGLVGLPQSPAALVAAAAAARAEPSASMEGVRALPNIGGKPVATKANTGSVGELFAGLLGFYGEKIDWQKEAVDVHVGKRSGTRGIDVCVLEHEDGRTEVAPTILDPFEPGRNVAACATASAMDRLREEIERARQLFSQGATLTELLEPWRPEEAPVEPQPQPQLQPQFLRPPPGLEAPMRPAFRA